MNLEMLKALKARGMSQDAAPRRKPLPINVAMMKTETLKAHFGSNETCGSCTRWLTCTKLHRAHRVSKMLSACDAYQFDSTREYQNG